MEHKIRTTVYLDKEVKRLADEDNLNLSRWVNDNLLIALCVESESDVIEKKADLEGKIKVLDERLLKMRESERSGHKVESAKNEVLDDLRLHFKNRAGSGLDKAENMRWITSPKNIARCKILGELPEDVLKSLEAWYDGTQQN